MAVTSQEPAEPRHVASYGLGLYTLLVVGKESRPVLYKQVSGESSFSIPAPKSEDECVIYLLNNRWIGMDEEIRYGHATTLPAETKRPATSRKPKRKQEIHVEAKSNQDEVDLLSFISWEDGDGLSPSGAESSHAMESVGNGTVEDRSPVENTVQMGATQRDQVDSKWNKSVTPQQVVSSYAQPLVSSHPQLTTVSQPLTTPSQPQPIPSQSFTTPPSQPIISQTPPNINVDAFLNTLFH